MMHVVRGWMLSMDNLKYSWITSNFMQIYIMLIKCSQDHRIIPLSEISARIYDSNIQILELQIREFQQRNPF